MLGISFLSTDMFKRAERLVDVPGLLEHQPLALGLGHTLAASKVHQVDLARLDREGRGQAETHPVVFAGLQGVGPTGHNPGDAAPPPPHTLTITSPASPGIFISSRMVNMECDLEDSLFS